jgi:hypothetical protein
VTSAEVSAAFGRTLPGPLAPLNSYEVCVFGHAQPGNYTIVRVTIYTPDILHSLGGSADTYFHDNGGPGATTVSGIGQKAYVKGVDIWVLTQNGSVLDIGANFVATKSQLEAIARKAAAKL